MMDRRDVLKGMAASLGGSIALPHSVFGRMAEALDVDGLRFFRPAQRAQVAMIAEAIIPKTDTPGAIEAGVPAWIEALVQDCFAVEDQKIILDGLAHFSKQCQEETGHSIDRLPAAKQVEFLTKYHAEERERWKRERENGGEWRMPFLHRFKELTKFTFVNSEVGGTQAFEYMLVPGKWDPAMPIKPGQKAWTITR